MSKLNAEQFAALRIELAKITPSLLEEREGQFYGTADGVVKLNEMFASKGLSLRAQLDVHGRYEYVEVD